MSSQMLSKEEAIAFYNKQIKAKVRKGYTEIKLALGKNDGEDGQAGGSLTRSKPQFSIKESKTQSCNLEQGVQDLLKFIFDKNMMEKSIISVGVDLKRMPLGDLSQETVLKGYQILREIEKTIKNHSTPNKSQTLAQLSGQFYTNIPHNFGMAKLMNFVIDDSEKIKQKLELI